MNVHHPFHFDSVGGVATADDERHLRDMLEQLLLTNPGERLNRPDFGCGLLRQVFEPNSPELANAVQYTVLTSIQRWLGDIIEPLAVIASSEEGVISVRVHFAVRRTGERREEMFRAGVLS